MHMVQFQPIGSSCFPYKQHLCLLVPWLTLPLFFFAPQSTISAFVVSFSLTSDFVVSPTSNNIFFYLVAGSPLGDPFKSLQCCRDYTHRHERTKGIYCLFVMEQSVRSSLCPRCSLGHMYTRHKNCPPQQNLRFEKFYVQICWLVLLH